MNEIIKICPYLGMADDPATNTSFPSNWNHCYHAKPVEVVGFAHQHEYCLSEKHVKCPVFQYKRKTSLPAQLRAPRGQFGKQRSLNWKTMLLVIFILAILVFAGFSLFSSKQTIASAGTLTPQAREMELTANAQAAGSTATQTPTIRITETESDSAINAALTQTAFILTEFTASPTLTSTNTLAPISTFAPPPVSPSKPKPKPKPTHRPPAPTP